MLNDSTMTVHRVVQSTRFKIMSVEERQETFDVALSILAARFPQQVLGNHMHNLWDDCEVFLPHVLAFDNAVKQWRPMLDDPSVYINMMCDCTWYALTSHKGCSLCRGADQWIVRYLWEIGQYDEALKRLEWVEVFCTETIGLSTLEAARIYVNRGSVYSTLNRYEDAGGLFQQGLNIRKELLPDDNQLVANSYMQVGNYYTSQERVDDAIDAHRHVIEVREKSPLTPIGMMVISYFNLCRTLLLGNRFDEADEYLRKAEQWEKRMPVGREALMYTHQSVSAWTFSDLLTAYGLLVAGISQGTSFCLAEILTKHLKHIERRTRTGKSPRHRRFFSLPLSTKSVPYSQGWGDSLIQYTDK